MSRRALPLLAFALALLLLPAASLGEKVSFPGPGIAFSGEVRYFVTPQTLDEQATALSAIGVDVDAMRGDYAVSGGIFDVFLESGARVSLASVTTEDSARWASAAQMPETEKNAMLAAFQAAPYQNAEWLGDPHPCVRCEYALEAGGEIARFAKLITVERGALYQLTATGRGLTMEALHEANLRVLGMITFIPQPEFAVAEAAAAIQTPAAIEDDGVCTPIALVDFSGVTQSDSTELQIETLPGADLTLATANDTLRGRADGQGRHAFSLSTRRTMEYQYTLAAEADGRVASSMEIRLERRLDPEVAENAYRRNAKLVEQIGYAGIEKTPVGTAVTFRGKALDFSALYGYPCALIYTQNPRVGVWEAPLWVRLLSPVLIELEGVYTVYGGISGETLAYTGEDGVTRQLAVIDCQIVTK